MHSSLFNPLQVGALTVPNRILLAPLTRARADAGHMPNALMAEYYAQRASGGLLITECTMVAPNTSAFIAEPGIYSPEQVAAWKQVTSAVHAKGGRIYMQIWHAGRAAHPAINGGTPTVSSTATPIEGDIHTPTGKVPHVPAHVLTESEIPGIVETFVQGAKNAIAAGFDGVEARDYCVGLDSEQWDQLKKALPKNTKARAVEHHASCPHEQVGALLEQVRKSRSSGSVKWAFEFIVLTAARSGEVRGAVWEEIDAKTKTWTIPKERMKAGREHSVPLSQAAWDVLQQARGGWPDGTEPTGLIFPGTKNKPISDMTLTQLLRRMQQPYTVHGFRASFRTWGADIAHYEHDMLEIALSHIVGDATVRAYHRSDMVEKRRKLMAEWAAYLEPG